MSIEQESRDGKSSPLSGNHVRLSRRDVLQHGLCGAGAAMLAGRIGLAAAAGAKAPPPKAKAKAVIQIWLAGGPPHLDTFDPKPAAGNDYCGPLNNPIRDQRGRHPHRRVAPHAGKAGRQVLAHPQHDPRRQRPRDGGLSDADRPAARRPAGLPVCRSRGLALQGLRGGLQGADSALHRAHPVAGAVFRSRFSGSALHAVRHRGRPGAAEVHGGRRRFARPQRPAAAEAARSASQARHPGRRRQRQPGADGLLSSRRTRPTT